MGRKSKAEKLVILLEEIDAHFRASSLYLDGCETNIQVDETIEGFTIKMFTTKGTKEFIAYLRDKWYFHPKR